MPESIENAAAADSAEMEELSEDDISMLTEQSLSVLSDLNLSEGLAGSFLTDLIQYLIRQEFLKKNFCERLETGRTIQEMLEKVTRLTAGQVFKAGTCALDSEV